MVHRGVTLMACLFFKISYIMKRIGYLIGLEIKIIIVILVYRSPFPPPPLPQRASLFFLSQIDQCPIVVFLVTP